MPSQQNIDLLKDTADKIANSKNVVIIEYQGLDVKSQVELRANIKKAGGELNVTKNRIIALALKSKFKDGLPSGLEEALQGPSAIVFGYDDAVATTKAIMDFAKNHESLKAKVGVLMADRAEGETLSLSKGSADRILTPADVEALSKLPGRQELLTMLVIQLQSPIQGFYNVLKGNLSGLARVLNGIKEQKENN